MKLTKNVIDKYIMNDDGVFGIAIATLLAEVSEF